jgi:hypothetical protein
MQTIENPQNNINWSEILAGLSQVSNPNYQNTIKQYNSATGLDVGGANQGYNAMRYLLPLLYKLDADQLAYFAEMQPEYRGMITQLLQYAKDPNLASDAFRSKTMGEAQNEFPAELMRLMSAGAGQGSKEGLSLASTNMAKRRSNEFDAQVFSPEGRMKALGGASDLIRNQMPNFGGIMNAHGVTTSTPRGTSGLEVFGNIAGTAAGKWKGWGQ